jgi:hypothetical protein
VFSTDDIWLVSGYSSLVRSVEFTTFFSSWAAVWIILSFSTSESTILMHCESRLSLQCDECYNIWSAIDLCDHKFIIKMVMKTLLHMCKGSTSGGTDSFILYIRWLLSVHHHAIQDKQLKSSWFRESCGLSLLGALKLGFPLAKDCWGLPVLKFELQTWWYTESDSCIKILGILNPGIFTGSSDVNGFLQNTLL